jgi:hypothetical protein
MSHDPLEGQSLTQTVAKSRNIMGEKSKMERNASRLTNSDGRRQHGSIIILVCSPSSFISKPVMLTETCNT